MSNKQKRLLKRTIWQHKRFALYGEQRMRDCVPLGFKKGENFVKKMGIKNYGYLWIKEDKGNVSRSYCEVVWEDDEGEHRKWFELPSKMTTVKNVVKDNRFWKIRYELFKKPIKDQSSHGKRKDEEKLLIDSINHYIEHPQFNQDFFIKNSSNMQLVLSESWQKPDFWKIFRGIR